MKRSVLVGDLHRKSRPTFESAPAIAPQLRERGLHVDGGAVCVRNVPAPAVMRRVHARARRELDGCALLVDVRDDANDAAPCDLVPHAHRSRGRGGGLLSSGNLASAEGTGLDAKLLRSLRLLAVVHEILVAASGSSGQRLRRDRLPHLVDAVNLAQAAAARTRRR